MVFVGLVVLVVVDYLALRELGVSYFRWYIANGSLISLFLAALAAGIDLDNEPLLVASNPASYLASWLTVPGMVAMAFSSILRGDRRPIDSMLTVLFALPLFAIWIAYLVVIVPLQYFLTLATGAPARLAIASPNRSWVERDGTNIQITSGPADQMPNSAEQIGLAGHPVTITSAFSAVLLFVVSFFL